jgi:hypothetical protein
MMLCGVAHAQPPADKGRPLDALSLPPGTVIFVTSDPRPVNPNVDAVILTPEEYRKLLADAERWKNAAAKTDVSIPAVCRLQVRVDPETNNVRITAHFQFRTESSRSTVALGLNKSRPVATKSSSSPTPALTPASDGGYQVTAAAAGEYDLTVETVSNSQQSGAYNRQFECGLPGAAITILESLELPPLAVRGRVNGQPLRASQRGAAMVLGPVKQLVVGWEELPTSAGTTMFTVDNNTQIRLNDRQLMTQAKLSINVLRGQVSEITLGAPANAKISVPDDKSVVIEPPNETRRNSWVLRRPPSAEPMTIDATVQQALTRRPLIVHGFPIAGATVLQGWLSVQIPEGFHVAVTPRGELTRGRNERPSPLGRIEAFSFSSVPANGILADVDWQVLKGEIETAYSHSLQLAESGWRLSTRMEIRPIRRELERLEIQLPPDLADVRIGPADILAMSGPTLESPTGSKSVTFRFTEPIKQPISVTIDGFFAIKASHSAATLRLPRLVDATERGGSVQVSSLPGIDVRGEVREWNREDISDWQQPLEPVREGHWNATVDRGPAQVDLEWRPISAEDQVQSIVDVEFSAAVGTIRQTWRFPIAPRQIQLHGPPELGDRTTSIDGGTIAAGGPGQWIVRPNVVGREAVVSLTYPFPFDPSSGLTLPLLWLNAPHRCETEVRLWAAPAAAGVMLPVVDSKHWISFPPPIVKDRPRIPVVAVRTTMADVPLPIHFVDQVPNLPVAMIDRVWVRATVDEVGAVAIRARFLVRPVRPEPLAIRLPGPPMLVRPNVRLDGKTIDLAFQDHHLLVPLGPVGVEHVIEVFCTLPARPGWNVRIDAPRPAGPVVLGSVRWQLDGPDGDIGFETSGELTPIARWTWHRGLLAPVPAISDSAMLRWFAGDHAALAVEPFDSALTATSSGLPTIWMTYWPRVPISVAASLIALAVGGMLLVMPWTLRRCALLLLTLLALFVVYCMWPQVVGQCIALAQPGLWVLIPAGLIGAWYRRRTSRQAVFAPLRLVVPQGPTVVQKTAI